MKNLEQSPYFRYAKTDHDIGCNTPRIQVQARIPAMPWSADHSANETGDEQLGVGLGHGERQSHRPASLRLCCCARTGTHGKWHALVMFVDAHRWPKGKHVYLNGHPRAVSPDLYEAMQADKALKPSP